MSFSFANALWDLVLGMRSNAAVDESYGRQLSKSCFVVPLSWAASQAAAHYVALGSYRQAVQQLVSAQSMKRCWMSK